MITTSPHKIKMHKNNLKKPFRRRWQCFVLCVHSYHDEVILKMLKPCLQILFLRGFICEFLFQQNFSWKEKYISLSYKHHTWVSFNVPSAFICSLFNVLK